MMIAEANAVVSLPDSLNAVDAARCFALVSRPTTRFVMRRSVPAISLLCRA